MTLDGAIDGLVFYLKPDMAKVLKLQVSCARQGYDAGLRYGRSGVLSQARHG